MALLDREQLGLNGLVFSHVKLAGHGRDALLQFEQAVREHPEILECYTLMGETDFLLRIVCRDIKAYEAFFLDHLSRFPGVQSVHSSIALSVIKETTALPLRSALPRHARDRAPGRSAPHRARVPEPARARDPPCRGNASSSACGHWPFIASTRVLGPHSGATLPPALATARTLAP